MEKRRYGKKIQSIVFYVIVVLFIFSLGSTPFVGAADPTIVQINPSDVTVSAGESFWVNVSCTPGQEIKSFELKLSYDPDVVQANEVLEGTIFDGFTTFFNPGTIDNDAGTIVNMYNLIVGAGTVSEQGSLVAISFTAGLTSGLSVLNLYDVGITNASEYISVVVYDGNVSLDQYTLTVTVSGSGSVQIDPDQEGYEYGDEVVLTAVGAAGYGFSHWTGGLSGSSNPATITMTDDTSITAHFVDTQLPKIVSVSESTSAMLDTEASFGWVNISCSVTDNVAVSLVGLNISTPAGSWFNVSMTYLSGSINYYNSSSSFSTAGNYTYRIWTKDSTGNVNTSAVYSFSMTANWDVDSDSFCTILDLVSISNLFGETGSAGWLREDVDNNGEIQVFDLVLVSNHYNESWWT